MFGAIIIEDEPEGIVLLRKGLLAFQQEAGIRIEPPPSFPCANATILARQ